METLGKYTLRKKLATGGMAEIWLASVAVSGVRRVCVVKRILPHLAQTPDFVRMFFDEARLVATLTHPNIVQLYDVGEDGGSPFIAMEYLHGADIRTIKRALRTHDPSRMPLDHAIHIGIGAAAGLHYAHEQIGLDGQKLNIVHRDISPQNILVTYDGAVKVVDFGIAKSDAHRGETQVGTLKGKVPYMSPEQCACEKLDRRSDIYSLGVVLYELTTAHRVHPLGASEYEMIRAIVEGTIAPPTSVDPSYPKALEAIVLRCLAKDRRRRYPTARALEADLDAFAREARLAVSSLALSSYMGDLFGKRADAWRDALAGGEARMVELAAVAPGADGDAGEVAPRARAYGAPLEGRAKVAPQSRIEPAARAALAPPPRTDATFTKRRIGELTVVSIAGKLNERFSPAEAAANLAGRVLLDLSGITRVTSFGVRAWLEMMSDATARAAEVFFCRCAEPVVNQMSMIKGFAGGGRVVSFHAPYRCEACGASWKRLFDCERDAAAIRDAKPPDADCPNCGAVSVFDDDARSYFAFAAPFAGAQPPLDVRAAMDELGRADAAGQGDPIEKTIDGRTTRIAVHAAIDVQIRWKRVFDGLEGDLEIDLEAAPSVTPEGAAALDKALRALGPEVEGIRVRGCPRALAEAILATTTPSRAAILSIAIDGKCTACDAIRGALIDIREVHAAARQKRDPEVPCRRCNAQLTFTDARPLLQRLAGDGADPRPSESPLDARTGSASVSSAPATAAQARGRALFAAGALVVGGAIASLLLWPSKRVDSQTSKPIDPPAAESAIASARAPDAPDPTPTWIEPPILVDGGAVLVVGAGLGATEDAALTAAQSDALDHLASQLLEDLGDAPLAAFTRARIARRAEALAPLAARYLAQVGATSTPVRVDTHLRRRGAQVEALARYRLAPEARTAAIAFYRASVRLGGMTIAPIFPLLERTIRTRGALIVIAIDKGSPAAIAGVREGDAILAVNAQAITSVDAIAVIASAAGPIEVRLDAGGAARDVKLGGR